MNAKVFTVMVFAAGLATGIGGYHYLGKGTVVSPDGDGVAQRSGGSGVGSMLGAGPDDGSLVGGAEVAGAIAMPDGFGSVRSLRDILDKPGPRDRFQALLAFVQSIDSHEIGEALEELRAGSANKFDPELMFAGHLLLMRWGEEDPDAAFDSLSQEERQKYLEPPEEAVEGAAG